VGVVAERENALRGRAHFEPQRDSASTLPLRRTSGVQDQRGLWRELLAPGRIPAIKVSSSMPIWPMLRIRRIYQIFDDMTLPRWSEWGVPRLGEKIHTWQRDVKY
jgi:hypothetical protein